MQDDPDDVFKPGSPSWDDEGLESVQDGFENRTGTLQGDLWSAQTRITPSSLPIRVTTRKTSLTISTSSTIRNLLQNLVTRSMEPI
jgi:hypothetical protein